MRKISEVLNSTPLGAYDRKLQDLGLSPNLRRTALEARMETRIPGPDVRLSRSAATVFARATNAGVNIVPTLTRIAEVTDGKKPMEQGTKGRERNKVIARGSVRGFLEFLERKAEEVERRKASQVRAEKREKKEKKRRTAETTVYEYGSRSNA